MKAYNHKLKPKHTTKKRYYRGPYRAFCESRPTKRMSYVSVRNRIFAHKDHVIKCAYYGYGKFCRVYKEVVQK